MEGVEGEEVQEASSRGKDRAAEELEGEYSTMCGRT